MKEHLTSYIIKNIEKLKAAAQQLSNSEVNPPIVLDQTYFDAKFLKEVDISEFAALKKLKTIKKPVLYWFEHTSSKNNKAIQNAFIAYSDPLRKDVSNPKYRYASSYKKGVFTKNNTLYVGKVEKGFWGRVVTHLGYSKFKSTAGMQLVHWYKPELYGNIKLNYIVFGDDMKHLILMLEKQLAKDLKPLIGRY